MTILNNELQITPRKPAKAGRTQNVGVKPAHDALQVAITKPYVLKSKYEDHLGNHDF